MYFIFRDGDYTVPEYIGESTTSVNGLAGRILEHCGSDGRGVLARRYLMEHDYEVSFFDLTDRLDEITAEENKLIHNGPEPYCNVTIAKRWERGER